MAAAERLTFSWRDVEALPDLERLCLVFEALPDKGFVATLEAGRGRNDSHSANRPPLAKGFQR